jgi:vesicle transport through interaction with t-SNAREs protein 1
VNGTERELDEAEEIISQMEMELLSLAPAVRVKLQPRVKQYKSDLEKMKRELVRILDGKANWFQKKAVELADRTALLGAENARMSTDADVATQDQRTRLLNGTERLQESSKRLENAHRVALETEQIGANTLGTLMEQREQILRTRDTLSTADGFIATSQRLLKGMQRRMLTNKLITGAVIVCLCLLIILVIWLKYF